MLLIARLLILHREPSLSFSVPLSSIIAPPSNYFIHVFNTPHILVLQWEPSLSFSFLRLPSLLQHPRPSSLELLPSYCQDLVWHSRFAAIRCFSSVPTHRFAPPWTRLASLLSLSVPLCVLLVLSESLLVVCGSVSTSLPTSENRHPLGCTWMLPPRCAFVSGECVHQLISPRVGWFDPSSAVIATASWPQTIISNRINVSPYEDINTILDILNLVVSSCFFIIVSNYSHCIMYWIMN